MARERSGSGDLITSGGASAKWFNKSQHPATKSQDGFYLVAPEIRPAYTIC